MARKPGSKAGNSKPKSKAQEGNRPDPELKQALRQYIRTNAYRFLEDPNVTSVGVGRKNNEKDGPISLIFTVGEKVASSQLESLEVKTQLLPDTIEIAPGITVPTDVEERHYESSYAVVEPETTGDRKSRMDPIQPGLSVGHEKTSAGTVGAIVYDEDTGDPCILSNWHVLHTNKGAIGERIVQPGPHDNNDLDGNETGTLLRSHLGAAGDCAIARIKSRGFDRTIFDLGVVPEQMADVEIDDLVVKSGRTTDVTYGMVRRTDVMVKIDFRQPAGIVSVGGFEIGLPPEAELQPDDGEISRPGDSGSLWMIRDGTQATDIVAGLHFAGEAATSQDEHAIACYPLSVQKKLRFTFSPPAGPDGEADSTEGGATGADTAMSESASSSEVPRSGFDPNFLGVSAPMPEMSMGIKRDAVNFGRAQVIPYTHFSVCLSAKRRLARFVAWNVDGAQRVILKSQSFRTDRRIAAQHQTDNSLYKDNRLDRGHIARRADLAWGPVAEARQANRDSYFYTNIAPQHERYNQSSRAGIWGRLENTILEQAEAQNIRCSVIGGPLFADDDPIYRGVAIPREFFKLIAYRKADGSLAAACFILSQNSLLSDIETIDFDPFRMFQVSVAELSERTGLGFDTAYKEADVLVGPSARANACSNERMAEALNEGDGEAVTLEIINESELIL